MPELKRATFHLRHVMGLSWRMARGARISLHVIALPFRAAARLHAKILPRIHYRGLGSTNVSFPEPPADTRLTTASLSPSHQLVSGAPPAPLGPAVEVPLVAVAELAPPSVVDALISAGAAASVRGAGCMLGLGALASSPPLPRRAGVCEARTWAALHAAKRRSRVGVAGGACRVG